MGRHEFKDLGEVKRALEQYADSSPQEAGAATILVDAVLKMAQEMADCQTRMADCQARMTKCEKQMADCQTQMAECQKQMRK